MKRLLKNPLPHPDEIRTRHHQSLAAISVMQTRLVAALQDGQAETLKQLKDAEATASRLRPAIKQWVEGGLKDEDRPPDKDLQAYLDAVHQAHELRLADNAAYQALRDHEETADEEPEPGKEDHQHAPFQLIGL